MNDSLNKLKKIEKIEKIWKLRKLYEASKKRKRTIWSREWLLRRDALKLGACAFVEEELLVEDTNSYKNYLRIDNELFEKLHSYIENNIKKQDTTFRQSVSSRFRLIVTLRFLATGETFQSLSYATRIATCTISKFVPEVLSAIYEKLSKNYLKIPSTSNEWQKIADNFDEKWNIPNTVGAMDGKHIAFRPPRSAGSHYYNYKGFHRIVLLAIVDANYRFIYIDVGTNGRVSDGGVYEDCDFSIELNRNNLNLPEEKPLPGRTLPVPYVLLADAAFPLQTHILKPFPFKNMTQEERIYNYRHSRGRNVVENAFGILANRFRILLAPINLSRDKVILITQACCALHKFIISESPNALLQEVDREIAGNVTPGTWRNSITENLQGALYRRRRPNDRSITVRQEFKLYFSNEGKVSWQNNKV